MTTQQSADLVSATEKTWLFILRDYGYKLVVSKSNNGNYCLFDVSHGDISLGKGLRSTGLKNIAEATQVGIALGRVRATSNYNAPAPPEIEYK